MQNGPIVLFFAPYFYADLLLEIRIVGLSDLIFNNINTYRWLGTETPLSLGKKPPHSRSHPLDV